MSDCFCDLTAGKSGTCRCSTIADLSPEDTVRSMEIRFGAPSLAEGVVLQRKFVNDCLQKLNASRAAQRTDEKAEDPMTAKISRRVDRASRLAATGHVDADAKKPGGRPSDPGDPADDATPPTGQVKRQCPSCKHEWVADRDEDPDDEDEDPADEDESDEADEDERNDGNSDELRAAARLRARSSSAWRTK